MTYTGSMISDLENLAERYVPERIGYSREELQRELFNLKDAHSLCYFRLLALNDADRETHIALFNVAAQILFRHAEVKEILKGVCDRCGYTPCECDGTEQLDPDTSAGDLEKMLGVPR